MLNQRTCKKKEGKKNFPSYTFMTENGGFVYMMMEDFEEEKNKKKS